MLRQNRAKTGIVALSSLLCLSAIFCRNVVNGGEAKDELDNGCTITRYMANGTSYRS